MNIKVKTYEIELTTRCNAACPGCIRTKQKVEGNLHLYDISISHIKKIFDGISLVGSTVYLCGTLGDPLSNKDIFAITEYLLDAGAMVEVHTNGGLRSAEFWRSYGELASFFNALNQESMKVIWNVDGIETNSIYRIGVDIKKVLRNMDSYIKSGGLAEWRYIKFDWNEHEIEDARKITEDYGIKFRIRSAWRNSNNFKIIEILPSSYSYDITSIRCKHVERFEVFISADGRVWPCCYIADEHTKLTPEAQKLLDTHGIDFNNTYARSLTEILSGQLFNFSAPKPEWDMNGPTPLSRCYRSCGENGIRIAKNERYEK